MTLDGLPLIDAHVHTPILSALRPTWIEWFEDFGRRELIEEVWDADGVPRPTRLDEMFAEEGVDVVLLFCEHSPKATGIYRFDDLLPIVEHNPVRFRPVANVNPHLHYPVIDEVRRQLALGAVALKLHPVHDGFNPADSCFYPTYQLLAEQNVPLIIHCGTSIFPGSDNAMADPQLLLPVIRDFPTLPVILAHGGRGWWFDTAAVLATLHDNVWIELSGLPPHRLPQYYARHDLRRLSRKWIFGTDWPGVTSIAANARAVAGQVPEENVPDVLAGNARRLYRLDAPALGV